MSWVGNFVDGLGNAADGIGSVLDVAAPFITTADEQREHEQLMTQYQAEMEQARQETQQTMAQSEMIQTAVLGLAGISVFGAVLWFILG